MNARWHGGIIKGVVAAATLLLLTFTGGVQRGTSAVEDTYEKLKVFTEILSLVQSGKFEEALVKYEAAARLDPVFPTLQLNAGYAGLAACSSHPAAEGKAYALRGQHVFDLIEQFGKPVIAAVNGYALGGGCELAMACTLRIAADTAVFGQPEIKLGIIPGGGGTQRMTRLIGEGKAMELMLTGDMISAEEAERLGLVNHVYPPEELEAKTMELANKIADLSPVALAMAKASVKNASRMNIREGLDSEVDLFALCFSSEDKEEGVRAFIEKRKADFKGK